MLKPAIPPKKLDIILMLPVIGRGASRRRQQPRHRAHHQAKCAIEHYQRDGDHEESKYANRNRQQQHGATGYTQHERRRRENLIAAQDSR